MRRAALVCAALLAVFCGTAAVLAHGGGHHPSPGYGGGQNCRLDGEFRHYDHSTHYGPDGNVWCDGTGPELRRHHNGETVRAGLPGGETFTGGFCIRSGVQDGTVLTVNYRNMAEHDRVWLQSGDLCYYPIDRTADETRIQIEDNGWADRNPAVGAVEAEVLFSKTAESSSGGSDGGGGCSTSASSAAVFLLLPLCVFLGKRNRIGDKTL